MVKGISRQVIVVQAPEPEMFEQVIFILKDGAVRPGGVTDDALLKEAKKLIQPSRPHARRNLFHRVVWTLSGAAVTALLWLVTAVL